MPSFQTIEEGLEALKKGGLVLVTDDPDRENEGDYRIRCFLREKGSLKRGG